MAQTAHGYLAPNFYEFEDVDPFTLFEQPGITPVGSAQLMYNPNYGFLYMLAEYYENSDTLQLKNELDFLQVDRENKRNSEMPHLVTKEK